jgi:hypothetical protein
LLAHKRQYETYTSWSLSKLHDFYCNLGGLLSDPKNLSFFSRLAVCRHLLNGSGHVAHQIEAKLLAYHIYRHTTLADLVSIFKMDLNSGMVFGGLLSASTINLSNGIIKQQVTFNYIII